jgi:hypothetical protein
MEASNKEAAGAKNSVLGNPAKGLVELDGAAQGWRASLVLDNDPVGVWRMEPLQIFPQYATPEVIGLDDNGTCWVMVSYSGKWTPQRVLADGAWLGGIAFADIDPQTTGQELYVGGKKGVLYQVRSYADGGLDGRRIASFPGLEIHTLIAGDVDPAHDGGEVLVFTRPGGLYRVIANGNGEFTSTLIGELPGRIRDAILLADGKTIVTASRNGQIALLTLDGGGPQWQIIHQSDAGCGRLAIGKSKAGEMPPIYSSGDNGRIFRHTVGAKGWNTETIYSGPLGPRGLVAGQFDPDPTVETVAIFGYSGRVEKLSNRDGVWESTTLFADRDRGHWLSVLEIDGRNNTDEIMLSGYGARMVLLSMDPGSGVSELAVPVKLDRHANRTDP